MTLCIAGKSRTARTRRIESLERAFSHLPSGVQDARERGGDVARLQRLHEQLADAGGECSLCQDRAAIATHQYDRQLAPLLAQQAREPGSGEPILGAKAPLN